MLAFASRSLSGRRWPRYLLLAPAWLVGAASAAWMQGQSVVPGLDRLRTSVPADETIGALVSTWSGRRIGIVTNHSGRSLDGVPVLEVFKDELELDVVALFSPEHGFDGDAAAGAEVSDRREESGPPIFSLYGDTRRPTEAMLSLVDLIVFDMQDVGVRFYTYAATMKYVVEEALPRGIDFVVLDRPNPLGGLDVEGPILEDEFASFVGVAPLPLIHGMTMGELAKWFVARDERLAEARGRLSVVPMRGWERSMLWSDTGLDFRAISPNIRNFDAAVVYPGFALFEGTNVSEGRGVETTFATIGAPWIDAERLATTMNAMKLAGVTFTPVHFVPRSISAAPAPKYRDERCSGVGITVDDARSFDAVRTGLETILAIRRNHPDHFEFLSPRQPGGPFYFDLLMGNSRTRRLIERGVALDSEYAAYTGDAREFAASRRGVLVY